MSTQTNNIETLRLFKVGANVTLTSMDPHRVEYGTVIGFALNSYGELCVGVNVYGVLKGDFEPDNRVQYIHPHNKVTSIAII